MIASAEYIEEIKAAGMTPTDSIEIVLPSTMAAVAEAVETARIFLVRFDVGNALDVLIVLRELLMNAVIHGNKNDPECTIVCRLERMGDFFVRVEVRDEGPGFDYGNLDMALPRDRRRILSRGYQMASRICALLEFNNIGNCISAYIVVRDVKRSGKSERPGSIPAREETDYDDGSC